MSSIFPNFHKLTGESQNLIENYTKRYLPFSDFNFVSLYCWDTHETVNFSFLNDNLIIKMKTYGSDDLIFSFLGTNKLENTIDELISYAKKYGNNSIELIPEISVNKIGNLSHKYLIREDRDQFDYIYTLSELLKMEGRVYIKRRNMLRMFNKSYKANIEILDIQKQLTKDSILNLCEEWKKVKIRESKYFDENEIKAIERFFAIQDIKNLTCIGAYIDNILIGFALFENLQNEYSIFHFEKTNHKYKGITEFIKFQTASYLHSKGVKFINAEQDLGIEGLRKAKLSYNPSKFLKKYTLSYTEKM